MPREKNKKQRITTKSLVLTGMFAAVLGVMSQISIPMPSGVPVTLQTFAVALTGYVLGMKLGTAATAVYVLIGAVGAPVFSGFGGGMGVLLGKTGGFIFGFLFMVFLCGAGASTKNKGVTILLSAAGLMICHLLGSLQFSLISQTGLAESAMLVSVPYLIKDIVSVVLAYAAAIALRRGLRQANISISGEGA